MLGTDAKTVSQWSDEEAARYAAEKGRLGERVYSSRLLGADPSLVLHGGGNTSVKLVDTNRFGDQEEILYVKGSGWDLASIEPPGFAPVRRQHLVRLTTLDHLSDPDMARELRLACTDPAAPAPSVEAILHALIPHQYVDHTHADALLAITNTPDGPRHVREVYGDDVLVVPYVMPGFDLARACASLFPTPFPEHLKGIILLNHGPFSFGATARESYERMVDLVRRAEQLLERRSRRTVPSSPSAAAGNTAPVALAALRRDISAVAGFPVLVRVDPDAETRAFARRDDVAVLSQQGPATPDHVIRTKRLPMLGRDAAAYAEQYRAAFEAYAPSSKQPLTMLDPAPRVVLDPEIGLATAGRSARDTEIAAEIYQHTVDVILAANVLGGYQALPEQDILAVEYWDLEQAKLRSAGPPRQMAGEVALVTGAASGIGRACAEAFLALGAAVVALDLNPSVESLKPNDAAFLGITCDVSDSAAVAEALRRSAFAFGGLDMLVLNAGTFPSSAPIAALLDVEWERTLRINLDANLALLRETHPFLKQAPKGGRVVVVGSKNVPAPGPKAGAYSASKAALTQLARVAALEWAADGIRVNVVHPNAVFDTGIWTDEVLQSRAASYGLSVDAYKRNNLLQVEITSADVARLIVDLCGPSFARTTGAQVPIDGGNERVI